MNTSSSLRIAITRWLAASCVLFVASPAMAQMQGANGLSDRAQRSMSMQMPQGLDFIDLSAAPGQRPRGALRFRFEGATRALRGFGMDADECRTLLRTTSRRATQTVGGASSDGGIRLGVTVSLNCSFF
jgi:hypothetical protein